MFVIVLSVLWSGVPGSDLCNVKVAMHGVLNMARHLADTFIWSCGVDGMGHCPGKPTWWSKSGILRERPGRRDDGQASPAGVQVENGDVEDVCSCRTDRWRSSARTRALGGISDRGRVAIDS